MKKFTIIMTALLFATISSPAFAKKQKQQKAKHKKTEMQPQKTEIKKAKHKKTEMQPQKTEIKEEIKEWKQRKAAMQPQKTEIKEEIKEWKQRKAAMQPLQLKDLVEENHRLKTSNRKLTEEIKVIREELEQLSKFKIQVETHKNRQDKQDPESLDEGNNSQTDENDYLAQGMVGPDGFSKHDWATDKNGQRYIKGLVFKVQMGAYKKRDLSNVLEGEKPQEVFEQEQKEGVNMYTLRHFRDYWKANQFKKELRAMGLKDAWIVAFKDGKRVPLKEVLQEITKKQSA